MDKQLKIFLALIILMLSGCKRESIISDKEYLSFVEKSFIDREQLAKNRKTELFSVFDKKLSVNQTEALKFLYAFMPLSDLADYSGDFFLANVDMSLHAKKEMPWVKDIPEDIFLHYILPCRINNENLDSFRIVYYDEILNRIKGKDIRNAALEINHWCHEKVSYQAADIRTSAPISTILSARGRCGEESTFTVAALRTAGIPARQVYTPRWAHSDDNHAWVEIWINGEWYYMGACEPEPVLDRGWFTEPARRAMLVHTKSFGAFLGNENTINRYKNFTDVNNLSKYAVTKRIFVKVFDKDNLPVKNAKVEYQLYNYAEFYPLAVVPTNENGISQFETGLGDLLIWAHKGDNFDYRKISVSNTDTLVLKLTRKEDDEYNLDIDLAVPAIPPALSGPSDDLLEQNSRRINNENIIRQKYIDSWINPDEIKALSVKLKIDSSRILNIINRSMGNYKEIRAFLSDTPDSLMNMAISLLEILPDKDLRDTKRYILSDHVVNSIKPDNLDDMWFLDYILNPRIANEIIVSWRSYFRKNLSPELTDKASANPELIVQYLNETIRIEDDENYYKTPLTPRGVNELKVSDTGSRSICFVAICRSLGIPSRLEPGSNMPQYFLKGKWIDVYFADQEHPSQKKGFIRLISTETNPVPEYYIHFTLARFENGRYNTLEYDYNRKITDFKEELSLAPGHYMFVTGNRLNDSRILSNMSFFDLNENEHKVINVELRKDNSENENLGIINLKNILKLFVKDNMSLDNITEKGVVVIWIEPDNEPTRHIFNDLALLKNELDTWGGYFLFLTGSFQNDKGFKPGELKGLPFKSFFSIDDKMVALKSSLNINSLSDFRLPYVVLADRDGKILFNSTGYRIGIGEQILKNVK
jgi:transglutaminase-like putative cysteine protease